jgi:ABC-2 type transport system permease protein
LGHSRLDLLLRVRARSVWNHTCQAAREAPIRLGAALGLVVAIWLGLYFLFWVVLLQFQRTPLEATVAIPLVFNVFFVAILAMLTFSNAIIAYGSLFGRSESAFLLAAPVTPRDLVTLKYLESLAMASWSLLLFGLPLMMALADVAERSVLSAADRPVFYVLFIAFFLSFIPIPGALGMLLAWAAARFFPRRTIQVVTVAAGIALAVFVVWGMRSLRVGDEAADIWLRSFLARMSFIEAAFLPNNWVAAGIDKAIHNKLAESLMYLGVTVANALFASWLAVMVVSTCFERAHNRASTGRGTGRRQAAPASSGPAGLVFFYLPQPLRLIAAKDLRTFCRDPMQWSQLVILFGLIVLYLTNMPTLRVTFSASGWYLVIPFLNLCAISLILATFTCRFVFPLVSLEGQQLWLVGLLPMPRGHVLLAKFAFAMTVTVAVAVGTMALATVMLELDAVWACIHLVVTVSICFGLCGFAVGIGARLPMFHQNNTARIANGLGGTTNLLASIALTSVVLVGVGIATWRSRHLTQDTLPDPTALAICAGAVGVSILAGLVALGIGARHFGRVEV